MGPNGAGKTTLLRSCAELLEPSSGSIEAPSGCALLGQRPDDYLVRERVGEELPGAAGRAALAAVGLTIGPETDPRDLSGGERQRLALAIALAGRGAGGSPAGLICLDEPTRGLDRGRKDDLASWIAELADAGAGVLVATHDVEFARACGTASYWWPGSVMPMAIPARSSGECGLRAETRGCSRPFNHAER